MPDAPTIHLVHATSPACAWSWGYEAVLNRVKLVYRDQVKTHLRIGVPYEDREQWLVDYGMSAKEATDWMNDEVAPLMGVPLAKIQWEKQPATCLPAALALLAALKQGENGWRFQRALVRMFAVEGKDPSSPAVIEAAVKEAGLDAARFAKDHADKEALRAELDQQEGPPVHTGFFNVALWDGGNRKVILDYTFDPREVEEAIDYLSGGSLKKTPPTDVVAYLREHGLAPRSELGRVFDLPDAKATTEKLEALEKAGRIERVTLAGAPHWKAI